MISLQKIFVNMVTDCLFLPALDISADRDWVTHWVGFFRRVIAFLGGKGTQFLKQNRDTAVSDLITRTHQEMI